MILSQAKQPPSASDVCARSREFIRIGLTVGVPHRKMGGEDLWALTRALNSSLTPCVQNMEGEPPSMLDDDFKV